MRFVSLVRVRDVLLVIPTIRIEVLKSSQVWEATFGYLHNNVDKEPYNYIGLAYERAHNTN